MAGIRLARIDAERGVSLTEVLVAMTILMIVSGVVMNGAFQLTRINETVTNRTEMHASVRSATELLQQEVGQAGRISLPMRVRLNGAVGGPGVATVAIARETSPGVWSTNGSAGGMFLGEKLVIDTGDNQETVTVTDLPGGNQISAEFTAAHAANAPVTVHGGFAHGIVPTNALNGSTGQKLKIFGDINGTGTLMYVEYTCDIDPVADTGVLYRNAMTHDVGAKPPVTVKEILLDNIRQNPLNPDGVTRTPCFTYQQRTVTGVTYVLGVAITLTVRTQDRDPVTGDFQEETKALLNVSPRNVFSVWEFSSLNLLNQNRNQVLPDNVSNILLLDVGE